MQNNGKEIYKQIGSTGELRNELNLSEDILLPEIAQTVAFTREEWTQLQREIAGQEGFQISEIIKAKLSEKIKLSTAAQESSVRARTGMRAEALRENLDKENDLQRIHGAQSKEILLFKVAESIESQKSTINLLKTTLVSIIQKLLVGGVKTEDINSMGKIISIDTGKFDLNETQSAALIKLKEINSTKSTPIYNYFDSSWTNMLGNVGEKTGEIKNIRDAYNSGKQIDKNSIMTFASEHPVVTGVVAVAGAYGLYKAFDAIFGDDDNSSKSSSSGETKKGDGFFDKLFEMIPGSSHWKGILASVLGVFGLGQALGNDKVKGFLKDKLGLNVDENRITKFLELIAKGEIWAAIKTLILGAEDAEKVKVTAEYNSLVADKIQKDCNLENKINPKLIETISQMPMKDYAASGFSIHGMWEGLKGMMTGLFSKKNPIDEIHEKKIKEYIMNKVKENKIQYKEDATVASVLLQIIPDTTKTMKQPETTTEKGNGISAGEVAAAGTVISGATLNKQENQTSEKKTDGKTEWSLGNPFLYVWMKGKRFEIGKTFTRYSIRKYISSIEGKALGIGNKALEIKELEKLEGLLQKGSLNAKEQQMLEGGIEKFLKNNPSILGTFHTVSKAEIETIIKDPELKKGLIQEQARIKAEAIEYHKTAEQLKNQKYQIIHDGEVELRKLAKDNHFSFKDLWKDNFGSNQFSPYSTKKKEVLAKVAEMDKKMLGLNIGINTKLEESLHRTNAMYEKHSLPSDLRTKTMHGLYGSLEGVGVTINKVVSKVPGSGIAKGAIKLGFIGLISGSLIRDALEGKETVKYDVAELGLGLLPISSEILDFKAAITGHDLAGRDLKSTDRWIRAGFGVVGTIADAAALVTFGQSEWLRTWMAGAKGAAKVGEVASDAGKLSRLKEGIFALAESSKFTRTVQMANAGGKVLTFGALGLATYDLVGDTSISGKDIKEKIHVTASGAKENIEGFFSKAA